MYSTPPLPFPLSKKIPGSAVISKFFNPLKTQYFNYISSKITPLSNFSGESSPQTCDPVNNNGYISTAFPMEIKFQAFSHVIQLAESDPVALVRAIRRASLQVTHPLAGARAKAI